MDTADMHPASSKVPGPKMWKVYFESGFWGHSGNDRPGKEIPLGARFDWGGHQWVIPAAWFCSRGMVMEFCMRVEPEEIRTFAEKWNLTPENDSVDRFSREEQLRMDFENPLRLDFRPLLYVNGQQLRVSRGASVCYNPVFPSGESGYSPEKQAVELYGLDPACGWVIVRNSFPWAAGRKPELKTLSMTMVQRPDRVPGLHFRIRQVGDRAVFAHPISGTEYTLTVRKIETQTNPARTLVESRYAQIPSHMVVMDYEISPEPGKDMEIRDCSEGDWPRKPGSDVPRPAGADTESDVIALIGGVDGPIAIAARRGPEPGRQPGMRSACSALYFAPVKGEDIEWFAEFTFQRFQDETVSLL